MNGVSLLSRFADVATSSLALAAYFTAVSAWIAAAYNRKRLVSKAEAILGQYDNDKARLQALLALSRDPSLGPLNAPGDVIQFLKIRDRQQTRILVLIGFVVLVAALVTMAAMTLTTLYRPIPAQESTPPMSATGSEDVPDQTASDTSVSNIRRGAGTANPPRSSLSPKERMELLQEYQDTERGIRALLRPTAPNPDPNYVDKLHTLIRRNREIAGRIGEQDSWPAVGALIEQRLPGTLKKLEYPIPEE